MFQCQFCGKEKFPKPLEMSRFPDKALKYISNFWWVTSLKSVVMSGGCFSIEAAANRRRSQAPSPRPGPRPGPSTCATCQQLRGERPFNIRGTAEVTEFLVSACKVLSLGMRRPCSCQRHMGIAAFFKFIYLFIYFLFFAYNPTLETEINGLWRDNMSIWKEKKKKLRTACVSLFCSSIRSTLWQFNVKLELIEQLKDCVE